MRTSKSLLLNPGAAGLAFAFGALGACGSSQNSHNGFETGDGGSSSSSGGAGSEGGAFGDSGQGLVGDGGGSSGSGCSMAAEYVYVVDVNGMMYSFYPPKLPNNAFTPIGSVSCAGDMIFSMAVDRNAVAWVLVQNGTVVKYDINTKTCTPTSYAMNQHGFLTFGMGFSADTPGSDAETLFVTDDPFTTPQGGGQGLARIDTTALQLTPVAQYDQLAGKAAEFTGTGDARLFGAFEGTPYVVAEIDKQTAHIKSTAPQSAISYPVSTSLAFAFWGGNFYLFIGPGGTTDVWEYQPSTQGTAKRTTENFEVVGAGVSTCAPTTPVQ
jgi:hypothetical protein